MLGTILQNQLVVYAMKQSKYGYAIFKNIWNKQTKNYSLDSTEILKSKKIPLD